ncbi:MAG: hypothetical protein P8Z35_26490 [Ignavibacteriaceae bacterium]
MKYLKTIILSIFLILYGCSASKYETDTSNFKYPSDLKVITREEWGWKPGEKTLPEQTITKITLHHSGEFFPEGNLFVYWAIMKFKNLMKKN